MQTIQGYWYDGKQSQQQTATIRASGDQYLDVVLESDSASATTHRFPITQIKTSSRLGNSSRYLYFPSGQKFETRDNDAVDQLLKHASPSGNHGVLHALESRWSVAVVSIVLVLGLFVWMFTDGVPVTAKYFANVLPDSVKEQAGQQTMDFLDEQWMEPSALTAQQQQRVLQHFSTIIDQYRHLNIRVLFRKSDTLGANAFALPDGTIVFTDDLVALSEHDDELLAIMAHEVGHVVHNHGMRNVIQGSLLGVAFVLLTGDISTMGELFLGLPVLLTQLGYSRDFEREADRFARDYMQQEAIGLEHFVAIMNRLEHNHCNDEPAQGETSADDCHHHDSEFSRYFSTHPPTQERLEQFQTQ